MNLSKSVYTKGIQCPKALWLKKYKPSVLTPPDEQAQAIFETRNIVGDFAYQLFLDGKEVPFTREYDKMIATTKKWLKERLSSIYESTFNYEGILFMVDILTIKDGEDIKKIKGNMK